MHAHTCMRVCVRTHTYMYTNTHIHTHVHTHAHIHTCIDEFNYRAWHFITSFIDYAIQIHVGQKAGENQWRVTVLEEFLHIALLYQATNTRNINVVAVLEQYLARVEKE